MATPVLVSLAGALASLQAQKLPVSRFSVEGVADLASRCSGGGGAILSIPCRELSLAVMAVHRGVGLASALGSDIPGSASTMGRRLGSTPRIGVSVSAAGLRLAMPRIATTSPADLAEKEGYTLAGFRGSVAAGVFDGFRLGVGVGGVLSVDLIGSYSLMRLPEGAGFEKMSSGVGLGARVGLIRESFVVPGLSISGVRRWHGDIKAGDVGAGHPGELVTDLTVSSLRATLGKNWFVLGLMGGVGWDRYEGDARLTVSRGSGDPGTIDGLVTSERLVYFVGGWFNFLVSQLSLEIGVAEGATDPFADRRAAYDPALASWFAAAAFRITL
ncbi:MAG: hypothetical protein OXE96_14165 [Gemmatimonadetes bacterium]|nr:hypothetical protein [Gemmatimonadota bacterium]